MAKISELQRRFALEYAKHPNGTQAAIAAGYAKNGAHTQANRLLNNATIREVIDTEIARIRKAAQMSADEVVETMATMARVDQRAVYDKNGKIIPIHKLPPEVTACIAEVIYNEETGEIRRYKFWPKPKGVDQLARVHSLYNDRLDVNVNTGLAERIARAKKRKAEKGKK